jgi:ferredoxin-NADP reductase
MGMTGMMGRPPPKQLYPQLMELPAMTPEARAKIAADAHARIDATNAALLQAQADYHRAMTNHDPVAMSAAASRQRAALAELISGTAALRALAEDKPPREIALSWFREQMNLSSPEAPPAEPAGPFGFSWFHTVAMAVVAAFALAMLVMGISRRHRSMALVNRLTATPPANVPAAGPARSATPPASAPTQPPVPLPATARTTPWMGPMRVAAIARETPHVKSFRFVPPDGGPIAFAFVPGQFLTFSAEVGDRIVRRSYTIASPPTRTSYVEITVKREDDGEFSRLLHDEIAVGDTLEVRGPSGAFTFDGGGASSIVLIAGGVGITPMMCVIRYLMDMSWPGEIFLVFAARNTDELIFREELEYLQRRYPKLHVFAAVGARSEGTAWMGLEGQITKDALAHAVPDLAKRRVHLCGPPPMMQAIRGILAELGVPENQIRTEAFGPATGLVPPPRPQAPPLQPASVNRLLEKVEGATEAPASRIPATGPATATISFALSAKSAPLPPDKTVLEVAESSGVPIDYSCRVGTCGLCKTKLLSGKVTMEVQDALTETDKTSGIILACQARSLGDLTIDA